MKKDFLSICDLSYDEIFEIFELSRELKARLKKGDEYQPLKGKTLAMIFQKPSTRTRVSFEVGMFQLGGHAVYLGPNDIQLGKREAVSDIARTISRYNDGIMARLFGHEDILELAEYANIPVINGLTDLLHPCQVLADAFTIWEKRGSLEELNIAFIGDGNNVCNSWLNLASKVPIHLSLGIPEGYDPDKEILSMAKKSNISEITIYRNPKMAVKNAEVIYTDVWTSMGQEKEAENRRQNFRNFQVDNKLVSYADPNCMVMHCLPARRGEEITDSVLDGPHSIVFDQAENRLHVQKAILIKLLT
ncbi:ornithine carbamoyltransferase [candidate division KSB1 bacterium]|nr:ornithine carbamoyltransferase [bacterium]OQX58946.1 MAG: ornithine carbamoyltransferase [candidate division KSB1 bacterium 4484_219]RKY77258.1 MAG: ornithine carbamoyltransferase [candidate division KSB1 bacterium]RKY80542.1 MAG: ornithine carbamoyltransferase [candidate division KSB1 bacterium]RKY84525.1 MAG: ornithine carbamoyltransferase [candidate division KSB1 bacterium]